MTLNGSHGGSSNPQMSGAPLFTIEQTELIRRLRNSGITKEQLIYAFESFERFDRDFGNSASLPLKLNGSSPQSAVTQGAGMSPTSVGLQTFGAPSALLSNSSNNGGTANLPSCSFASQQRTMMELGLTPVRKRSYAALEEGLDATYDCVFSGDRSMMMVESETEDLALELNEFAA